MTIDERNEKIRKSENLYVDGKIDAAELVNQVSKIAKQYNYSNPFKLEKDE